MYVFLDLQLDSEYVFFFPFSCSGEADHEEHDFEPCQGQKDENAKPPQATDPPQDATPQDAPPLSPQATAPPQDASPQPQAASQLANDERPTPNTSPGPSSDSALDRLPMPGFFGPLFFAK